MRAPATQGPVANAVYLYPCPDGDVKAVGGGQVAHPHAEQQRRRQLSRDFGHRLLDQPKRQNWSRVGTATPQEADANKSE